MARVERNRSLADGLKYRGREGMWSWMLHRATGLGILFYLIIHVVDTATVIYWPDFYDHALALYRHPVFRFGELFIIFAVLFHAVNGLRIVIQDFWPMMMLRQRELLYATTAIVLLAMLPITWIMVAPIFGLADEPGVERHELRMQERELIVVPVVSGAPDATPTEQQP